MDRRAYLAGVAGAASLLAGCSGRLAGGADPTPTVTPAPVPGDGETAGPLVEDGVVQPPAVGTAHVETLAGRNARLAVEYAARTDGGEPVELVRVVATLDDSALTYRRYVHRPLDLGGTYQLFRGYWYEAGDAVARLVEAGNRSVYREPDDFTPPSASERFERDGLVATLAAFRPAATRESDGYRLAADRVAEPERLPMGRTVDPGREGRLAARLESSGLVPALDASVAAASDGEPVDVRYRLAVTGRGTTTVERPTPGRTFEWYQELRNGSPIRTTDGEPAEEGDTPGENGA